ncbi:MAG TPA: hypothetical protein VN694_07345 [Caulobacteraceae bacterium]|nr:hypothetical protein [Caulobacteraceae bacterium]
MDGKLATLAGAAALAAVPALAGATPQPSGPAVPVAATYAELLSPIPNASERLQQADAQLDAAQPQLIEAQYYNGRGYNNHHHHHQHNHYNRSWYMAHGYYWYGGRWVMRPRNHHHHHHHHNYNY